MRHAQVAVAFAWWRHEGYIIVASVGAVLTTEAHIMTSLNKLVACFSLVAFMAFSPRLPAQSGTPQSQSNLPPPTSPQPNAQQVQPGNNAAMSAGGDAQFVMTASAAGDTEIIASRLALQNAQSAAIKSFAQTMVRDHTAANDKLRTIAQKDGFTLAGAAMVDQKPDLVKLQSLHGKDFDKAYADMMRKDHQDAVTLFTTESSSGNNADLKQFATQTLPILQHHLQLAQSL
jgi:putative membrane protein